MPDNVNVPPSITESTAIGERVVVTSPGGRSRHAGVLLPPVKDGEPHRVHTDKGRVVRLDGTWLVAPERSAADRRRDRRRRCCDAGRPIYRYEDLPSAQLATRTMLRKQFRRRPAEGQDPVASYMVHRGFAPLYAVIDAKRLPPLPPVRKAAWDRARTCARCGATQATLYTKGLDGRRYCEGCHEPAAAAWWYGERATGRTTAAAWAAELLADMRRDPDKVALLYVGYPTSTMSQTVRAETWKGEVLFSARVCDSDTFYREGQDTHPAELADAFRRLGGRRLLSWRGEENWLSRLQEAMHEHVGDLDLTFAGGRAGPHWDEWQAERPPLIEPHPFQYQHQLRRQEDPSCRPPELLAHVRHVVTEMAIRACHWHLVTCPECELSLPFGTSAAADRWAKQHSETGHTISHRTEPGDIVPSAVNRR
ncbi:hypothetical protein [Actinomadura litoris]|uniref:hypothetical protein n=1 Tax=Actinomadura litoris TaxID=2678616 RepID=UPI001FA73094|nr:hypothetical protein [Actinomadura litoris]